MTKLAKLLLLIPLLAFVSPVLADDGDSDRGRVLRVNCDNGKTIARALRRAKPGDTIRIKGTCNEKVTITTDNLTLEGKDSAAIDGTGLEPPDQEFNGLITVDGAQGVTIRGLTIQSSSGQGIFGVHGANMVVQDVRVEDHFSGIELSNSSAELIDVSVLDSERQGIDVYTDSAVIFRGNVEVSGSQGAGIIINGNSAGEVRGGHLNVHDNQFGVVIIYKSNLSLLAFEASVDSTLSAMNNLAIGIAITDSILLAAQLQPSGQMITSSGNGGPGILMTNQGVLESTFPFPKFIVENNPVGIDAAVGSTINVAAGLIVRDNLAAGIVLDDSSMRVGSTPDNPSSIQALDLKFGSRSTLDGVTVGSITCDPTVLSQGTTTCP